MEIWKDVEYYEGIYQISNLGRVKSLARKDSLGRNLQEKILSVTIDGGGYFKVGLSKEGKMKTKKQKNRNKIPLLRLYYSQSESCFFCRHKNSCNIYYQV